MKILDENAKWWIGAEKEWAYQAKNGDWWIIKNEEKKEKREKKMSPCNIPAQGIISLGGNLKKILLIMVFAGLLGISLGINAAQYLKIKNLENAVSQQKIIKSSGLGHRDQPS